MAGTADTLKSELRRAGLSKEAVEAAWPEWWSDEAETSPSARTELRLSVARSLGLAPRALVGERVDFVWRDRARFKHLRASEDASLAALNSFGVSVGRSLIAATDGVQSLVGFAASDLRGLLLGLGTPNLPGLLALCWAVGIPVAHLRVWPLSQKAMHAMVIAHRGRHAVLINRDVSYPALAAFTLAHEIGHIALGHVPEDEMLVDAEDPAGTAEHDDEETAADRFALELLMGNPDPDIRIELDTFNHAMLADAVLKAGPLYGIDPGTLAMAVAHRRNAWPVAMAAMRLIQPEPVNVAHLVNKVAEQQLQLERLGSDTEAFITRALGFADE